MRKKRGRKAARRNADTQPRSQPPENGDPSLAIIVAVVIIILMLVMVSLPRLSASLGSLNNMEPQPASINPEYGNTTVKTTVTLVYTSSP